jgi:hypothetical protein
MPVATNTVYLVVRWHWRVRWDETQEVSPDDPRTDVHPDRYGRGGLEIVTYQRNPDESGLPVRAFRDPARAEAFRREQEQAKRAATNPFRYGWNLDARTSLDPGRLRDWLLDAGLTPPGTDGEEEPGRILAAWQRWWRRLRGRLADTDRVAIAKAVNSALAGRWYFEEVEGPDDLAWLDEQLALVGGWTFEQRSSLRMSLIGTAVREYPYNDGERDHYTVEAKWRDWWDENHEAMTEHQRLQVWEALDKVRFFEVLELDEAGDPPLTPAPTGSAPPHTASSAG